MFQREDNFQAKAPFDLKPDNASQLQLLLPLTQPLRLELTLNDADVGFEAYVSQLGELAVTVMGPNQSLGHRMPNLLL